MLYVLPSSPFVFRLLPIRFMSMLHFYRVPALSTSSNQRLLDAVRREISPGVVRIDTELCFNVEVNEPLSKDDLRIMAWLLSEPFNSNGFSDTTFLGNETSVFEVGPRMNFTTAWSSNAVSVFRACGLNKVERIERSRRFRLSFSAGTKLSEVQKELFLAMVHDKMTEVPYPALLQTFDVGITPEPVFIVPVMEEGRAALERINRQMGLGFDEWDLDYYTRLFSESIGRNPTNVECFDMGQSNSEHSRHWFFSGELTIDGVKMPESLLSVVKDTYRANPNNSVIAFSDNSSAIKGFAVRTILPLKPGLPSPFEEKGRIYHVIFTAETHNFPTGVAPFPGAETGTGGRIRDVQSIGRGGLVVAGTAAYCVGNLRIPGYELPWENKEFSYPANLASPLDIEIEASNGASDYGNKFGEPVIQGTTRSFGLRLPTGERREWIKPIMFTGGIGQIDACHLEKQAPEPGMWVVKVGGPAYRIGMGGGAASSMIQGENVADLDFNAVQRGDAEMEQKMNRVIRACVELGEQNPIISIHDQGAGGNCNVIKEIIYPAGARLDVRDIQVGDHTLSVLEIWGAEYQENNALLLRLEQVPMFEAICKREKVPFSLIGRITGDGRVVLYDRADGSTPVDLDLEKVLGEMPRKNFDLVRIPSRLTPLSLPDGLTVKDALDRVFRLLSVGSKRFLTSKVDRSVTGLIARQQCAGPLQLTVSDVAVIAQSHFGTTGAATAIGEQPIKGLLDPAAMARMSVGEALTNIVWAAVTGLEDIRCSANWMWAAKLPGEGAALYDAAVAMRDIMIELGIAVDGGKDSLSMAALVKSFKKGFSKGEGKDSETVKSPGTLTISAYVTSPDVTLTVTPDIKRPGKGRLYFIDLSEGQNRLGGSALAQVFEQIGDEPPDIEDPNLLKRAFGVVQELLKERLILSGHDRSDGGLVTTLLEMAFAGNCGINIDISGLSNNSSDVLSLLFSEELGLVVEIAPEQEKQVFTRFKAAGVSCVCLGDAVKEQKILIRYKDKVVLDESMIGLRDLWEETSFRLEVFQTDPELAREEQRNIRSRKGPDYLVSFMPEPTPESVMYAENKPRVAVIREEGSNGDREMTSAFYLAGLEPWDVTMTDLLNEHVRLSDFRGVVFVGGFSYADVLDSAKGWAGAIRFNRGLWHQFQEFYLRQDTFSLGVCNGCQLMALLGWIPGFDLPDASSAPCLIRNDSGRFESRFVSVKIIESPAIMLAGMERSRLGVWVAHGEGKFFFPDPEVRGMVIEKNLAPLRYVDDEGETTEDYPFNPNGSPEGISAICSPDGRHLAMMPHPERAVLKWQWGWMPENMKNKLQASPWLRMFQNARVWCEKEGRG